MINSEGHTLICPPMNGADGHLMRVMIALQANQGKKMTLAQLSGITGIVNEGSIASRIRELRTPVYGFRIIRTAHATDRWLSEYCFVGYN